jgi:hypothetical protein
MQKQVRSYVARKYVAHNYGSRSFYEEGLFGSYDSAYKFIERISEEDNDRFLSEIVSFITDDMEPWENAQTWTFDRKGKLIRFYDPQKKYINCRVVEHDGYKTIYREPKPDSYKSQYTTGDIVLVKAFPWNVNSPTHEDTIGVVANTPIPYEEWMSNGNDKYEWDNRYVINFIGNGYLDHMHLTESSLELYLKELPNNIYFIKHLSDHFKGHIKIDKTILKEIFSGKVFVERVHHFDENTSINT